MNTARQTIEAALSGQGSSQTPAVIPYEGIYVRDHWRALTPVPWWQAHSPNLGEQLAWWEDAIGRTGQDWFELPIFYSRQQREDLALQVRPEGVYRLNRRTGSATRLAEPRVSGWSLAGRVDSVRPAQLALTPADIDAVVPQPSAFDAAAPNMAGRDDLARVLIARHPELYPLGYVAAPLWRTYQLWGFEDMMAIIATRPDLVRHACERYLAEGLCAVRMAAWLGAAGVWIEDCLTDMISPQAFETFNVPYVRRLAEEIRDAGMQSIHYFCGNPAGKWEALLSTGVDALSFEESKKGFVIDVEEVVQRVEGRCAVLGNLDAIGSLQDGSETQLRAEVARQLRAGRRNSGRFVMSLGSPVTPGNSVERVRLYLDMAHEISAEKERGSPIIRQGSCHEINCQFRTE
jgi:hypothetical protein